MESDRATIERGKTLLWGMGLFWLIAGVSLLYKGLGFLAHLQVFEQAPLPLAGLLLPLTGDGEGAGMVLVAAALALGAIKGRLVLRRVAERMITRVRELPSDLSLFSAFGKGAAALLIGAMAMGWVVNNIGLPVDIRGLIDVAVGSALVNSALVYFRA